ncbi:Nitrogen assimilation transcription factor nit-4-like protein 1 [Colletotrichum kahawae]|uniref:Nitrogen assimilation transcription factor nit-4-like protein 1 n=1 Tax=Colletotrichum kahawae TaxID=34407 RepID=A0AAE0D7B0_COLKA|nr:Nitrogen assimilation transcription factor nit-4-like protein 1 [Colletotrichum kahawae]
MVKNPTAYPTPKSSLTASERADLLGPKRLRRSKSLDHHTIIGSINGSFSRQYDPIHLNGHSDADQAQPASPKLCDPRLRRLKISFWTDVPITDDYAKQVISLYMVTDHPLLGIFDPSLFISDLVDQKHTHCSPLLVNALLYWACQMYTAIEKEANKLAELFCKEAERLWLTQKDNDSLLNAASSQLLSLAYLGHGKDHYVLKYLSTALRMGTRLCLFGVEAPQAITNLKRLSPETQRASSFTAWGVFNWGVLMALFYQQPGLEYPGHPPVLPIPGDLISDSSSPGSSSLGVDPSSALPPYMGSTFSTLCQFWRILHGVTLSYYKDKQTSLPEHASIDFAEFKYRELLAWIEGLPSDQALKDHSPHHVVVLHIWFHAAILDLFRPFLQNTARDRQRLKTFSARRSYPEAAFNASVNQLKQLIVRYRCNYESSAYTMLWQTALIYVANAVLRNTQDPEWRLYFLACIYGYEGLRTSYRVAEVISRGLLTMSLREGDMSGTEARHLLKEVTGPEGAGGKGDVRATFMADLDLAMTDPEAAKVENLAKKFEDVALFSDFTTMDDEEARSFQRIETPDDV